MYMAIITDKEKQIQHFKSKVALCILIVLLIGALIYVATGTPHSEKGYLACAGELYLDIFESESYFTFGAGFIGGLLGYPMASLIGNVPTVLICILVLLAVIFGITNLSINDIAEAAASKVEQGVTYVKHKSEEKARVRREYIAEREAEEAQREMFIAGGENDKTIVSPQKKKRRGKRSGIDIPLDESTHDDNKTKLNRKLEVDCDYKADVKDASKVADEVEEPQFYESPEKEVYGEEYEEGIIQNEHNENENVSDDLMDIINRASKNFDEKNHKAETEPEPVPSYEENRHNEENSFEEELENASYSPVEIREKEEKPEYHFPPVQLLSLSKNNNDRNASEEMHNNAKKLIDTLDSFNVKASIVNICRGPSVTRYELQPEQGVKVSRIVGLADDIKLNLAVADLRIEAPIPGKAAVGIEVPNSENTAVMLGDLLESKEFKNSKSPISFAVGKDIAGKVVVTDIAKMPHLLVAGATGSGKSVCINTLIMSVIYKADPDDVKLILVDPKVVELSVYNGIPHLMIPVVTDMKKAAGALNWAVTEMEKRYKLFAQYNVRDLKGFNEKVKHGETGPEIQKKLPQIVIIIDELADLMMVAPGEVEGAICRLAQLARAAGLHLILATQRPSVNVITGLIKANMPSRIAFSVSSGVDSRTIIDMNGAEKLLGKGDMLFYPSGYPKPVRVQGSFVSDEEVQKVVDYLIDKNGNTSYSNELEEQISSSADLPGQGMLPGQQDSENSRDVYFADAGNLIIDKEKASIGMLQRMFKIGFNRAARIMGQLCEAGVVGPEEGTKPRKVLMTKEEFAEYMQNQTS